MNKLLISVGLIALFGCNAVVIAVDELCIGREESEFFAKPGSCSELYHCYKGELLVRTCPDKLWFDSEHLYCTYQSNAVCSEEEIPSTEQPEQPELKECEKPEIVLYEHEDDCSKYFICPGMGQRPIEATCSEKYYFSAEQTQCVPMELVECAKNELEVKCPEDLLEGEIAYLAHPKECDSYFLCVNKNQHKFSCQDGLLWNEQVNSCDHKENVVCAE